jgi:hypothetical protein
MTRIRVWDMFKDRYVHFESIRTGMRISNKFNEGMRARKKSRSHYTIICILRVPGLG